MTSLEGYHVDNISVAQEMKMRLSKSDTGAVGY
jgi:hypothetical protein